MLQLLALGLALSWMTVVVLGLSDRRRGAAVAAGLTAVAASVPFVSRPVAYLYDREGFIARYGAAAVDEVSIGAVCVTLALGALFTTPLAARRSWGWLVPATLSLPPVALFVWLAFWFRIF